MAKRGRQIFFAQGFSDGAWAPDLTREIKARQRFLQDWRPKSRIWRGTWHQWVQFEPDGLPKGPFFWSAKPAIRATRPKRSRVSPVIPEEALFVGCYIERGFDLPVDPAEKQLTRQWHWHGFLRCLSDQRLNDLMMNLPAVRRAIWIDCSEAEHNAMQIVPPLVRIIPFQGQTSVDQLNATISQIPPVQWINVMLGVRFTRDECLAMQTDLVDQLRTPIVRAHEIVALIKQAMP